MNYSELEVAIQDYLQTSETTFVSHINDFIKASEDKIFSAVKGPLFWKASPVISTVDGTRSYTLAAGTVDVLGVRLCEEPGGTIGTDGPDRYVLRKDIDFLREAYPAGSGTGTLVKGIPKHYSVTTALLSGGDVVMNIEFGPVPDAIYQFQIEYYGKAKTESITSGNTPGVTSTTETWVSVAFPDVLMWGAIVQGYIYIKGEADIQAQYQKNFDEGLLLLKNMAEMRQDTDTFSDVGTQQGQVQ